MHMYMVVFLLLFVCSNPHVQKMISKLVNKEQPDIYSGVLLAIIASLVYIFVNSVTNKFCSTEPFLFEVTKNKPQCHGLYTGRPTTFQYDRIGCGNPPVGGNVDMITVDGKSMASYCAKQDTREVKDVIDENQPLYGNESPLYPSFR